MVCVFLHRYSYCFCQRFCIDVHIGGLCIFAAIFIVFVSVFALMFILVVCVFLHSWLYCIQNSLANSVESDLECN